MERYVHDRWSTFERLAADERGLPAVDDFFEVLIETRSRGERAGWGCMISNAYTGADSGEPGVRAVLAHAVNLRSRAGAEARQLRSTVRAAVAAVSGRTLG